MGNCCRLGIGGRRVKFAKDLANSLLGVENGKLGVSPGVAMTMYASLSLESVRGPFR